MDTQNTTFEKFYEFRYCKYEDKADNATKIGKKTSKMTISDEFLSHGRGTIKSDF